MRYIWILCLLCLGLAANKCRSKKDVQEALLQKTWLHSHEEDQGEIRVYRPNTYDFPPSHGRTGFTFEPNGVFKQYDIAPTDGLEEHLGKWEIVKDDLIRISFSEKNVPGYEIKIEAVEDDVLKIKRRFKEQTQ
ncbi:MAG: hypothetical protein LPJ89_03335 [Hymenobacteraceae bacterium]|nr:hypothetical protein [Hymenobacteraceae bacterium]MDX5397764.1 hypothetical protein [Hymenobacteraceae bacterium]MDX5442796.1 hypothetical protein [Hymenobacteraceae bacterium]MDX5513841.1 hypothetical protein [Hymenobacteraceae bacterium]